MHDVHTVRVRTDAARAFAAKWAGRGYEKGDTGSFWLELLRDVVGMNDVTTNVRFEQATATHGYIDVIIPDAKTVIEQKSLGIDLDKPDRRQGLLVTPFEQAKRYADSLPNSQRPDRIIVCDFDHFRIHDLEVATPATNYVSFRLAELPEQLHLLDFLVDPQLARRQREERVSLDAGRLIGRLYDLLHAQYLDPDSEESRHSLNVLCVRLVFCLFSEDAGLFPKDAFANYLAGVPARQVRGALRELFDYMNTAPDERDPYASQELRAFPYVNGGLFADAGATEIPNFTDEIVKVLVEDVSKGTDWSAISPTIFGGVFESTLNPETRRSGGMHYTSPANIHRVIDPLFLDDLKAELDGILNADGVTPRARAGALGRFHDKLASLTFFDPACGSGNFLSESYLALRRLENQVLSALHNGQAMWAFDAPDGAKNNPLKVSLKQFVGIEINDFAANVARTALWIAELQANAETQTIVMQVIDDLPLTDSAQITLANALEVDWEEVLPADLCSYIIGNPPFRGARYQTREQKAELVAVFNGARNVGNIDYVAGWFMKAAQYMGDHKIRAAFVATNSICQGEQVANVWSPIYDLGVRIDFAHDTFKWTNEASGAAAVFVVVVGFSKQGDKKRLFRHPRPDQPAITEFPAQLNAYLKDAPDVFVWSRSKPICDVPPIGIGSQPLDDGNYLFTSEEKLAFLEVEPGAEKYFRRWLGAREFIQGIERWALWLGNATPMELARMPEVMKRVKAVREFRSKSNRPQTRKAAAAPQRFGTEIISTTNSLLIPQVSSERRNYIPLGFVGPETLCSDKVRLLPNATLYHFGMLHSSVHNAWMRMVGVRLKSDYSYSNSIVYNNFVWPDASEAQMRQISALAQDVLTSREGLIGMTIAEMYDPDRQILVPGLVASHAALDEAVKELYGAAPSATDGEIVALLMRMYADRLGVSAR
ncbi:class I SAM-dependent DNA methyltransferase [Flavimobilis sp. GY10621]|uniref:site-specific DNA-methyltransferase (adenine-specific) n=1 Tax=Flavimobilis rhizosphaerae TaxID=2775421 RepID=A0ABR9DQX9_9MICO|nr:class I SAM-dependent DNA methyltransferase [Flavimobilis rhizosphaerae]MBD9699545.1 class I SAM-dependent DNA methyltransferase [Flavimobilis rhizosphaerae]